MAFDLRRHPHLRRHCRHYLLDMYGFAPFSCTLWPGAFDPPPRRRCHHPLRRQQIPTHRRGQQAVHIIIILREGVLGVWQRGRWAGTGSDPPRFP